MPRVPARLVSELRASGFSWVGSRVEALGVGFRGLGFRL